MQVREHVCSTVTELPGRAAQRLAPTRPSPLRARAQCARACGQLISACAAAAHQSGFSLSGANSLRGRGAGRADAHGHGRGRRGDDHGGGDAHRRQRAGAHGARARTRRLGPGHHWLPHRPLSYSPRTTLRFPQKRSGSAAHAAGSAPAPRRPCLPLWALRRSSEAGLRLAVRTVKIWPRGTMLQAMPQSTAHAQAAALLRRCHKVCGAGRRREATLPPTLTLILHAARAPGAHSAGGADSAGAAEEHARRDGVARARFAALPAPAVAAAAAPAQLPRRAGTALARRP